MATINTLRDKINNEGHVSGIGIPLILFDKTFKPSISVYDAVALGMGNDWSLKDTLQQTIQGHVQNTETVKEFQQKFGLTEDECSAITYYSCDARPLGGVRDDSPFRKLNVVLSKRKIEELVNWKSYLYFLLSGLQKLPNVTEPVYRALDVPITNLSKQYKVGNTVVWVGFTSTSKERSAVDDFVDATNVKGTFMLLNVTEGKDISELSLFPTEKEILLLPNSTFEVKEVLTNEMKTMMKYPVTMDGIILTQKPTPLHLLLLKSQEGEKAITDQAKIGQEINGQATPSQGQIQKLINPQIGGIIEVFDSKYVKDWYTSRIIFLYPEENSIDIHYEGWDTLWDEKLNLINDAARIRPFDPTNLKVGNQLPVNLFQCNTIPMNFGNISYPVQWGAVISKQINIWDIDFGSHYFLFSPDKKITTFFKCSTVVGPADYNLYPVARIPYLFDKLFSVHFKMSGYGWFGIASENVVADGFPGYTPTAWMFCTNGRLIYKNEILPLNFNIVPNQEVLFTCDPTQSVVRITSGGISDRWTINPAFPKQVYFVVSISIGCVSLF